MTQPSGGERVLVVDDEADIVALVAYHLAKSGYKVSTATTGSEALESVRKEHPSLVVLDLMLPDMSGFDVLAIVRSENAIAHTPVLMLTARREESDRIQGLTLGADDYLTKPFSPQELILRVHAILRRINARDPGESFERIGVLRIDRNSHAVTVADQPIELTPTEYKLLLLLVNRKGRVQARAHLLETVWDAAPDIQTRTVDMHVQRLRTKLGIAGEMIETVRGFGYRLSPPKPVRP
jgi:two-component system, OmpR family, phosphate regulon response regulator PhoB